MKSENSFQYISTPLKLLLYYLSEKHNNDLDNIGRY